MKHTHESHHHAKKAKLFFPFIIICLLLVSAVIALVQVQNQQELRQRAATSPSPTNNDCTVAVDLLASNSAEQSMYSQINLYRQQQGLPPLSWSDTLKKAATWMSQDMLTNEKLNHVDSINRDFPSRIADCDYPLPAIFGENIDNGTTEVATILNSWQHSPPHKANLLNPHFSQIGISLATGSATTQSYWTVNFAGASPSATLSPSVSASPSGATPTKIVTKIPTKTPTKKLSPTIKTSPTKIPTPTIYPGYVQNPEDTQILVSAKIPNVGSDGNKNPNGKTKQVEVSIYDATNKEVMKKPGTLTYDGTAFSGVVHLGILPNGTYYMKVATPFALQALVEPQFQVLRNDRLNTLPQIILVQGDLSRNNILTLQDYNMALDCFQNKSCVSKNAIDLNDDGKVNIADYNLLLENFWAYRGD